MTEEEIIAKAKTILNETGDEEEFSLLSEDTVKIEDYITAAIPEAVTNAQRVSVSRPVNVKSGDDVSSSLTPDSDGCCILDLPDDFVLLRALKLSTWKRACTTVYPFGSEEYLRQCNEYTRAGTYKPVVIAGQDSSGGRQLWLYSSSEDATVDLFNYEAIYEEGNGISADANDPAALGVCYLVAALVYDIFENSDTAQKLRSVAVDLLSQQP